MFDMGAGVALFVLVCGIVSLVFLALSLLGFEDGG